VKAAIVGAGGHATVVADTLLSAGRTDLLGFVDGPTAGRTVLALPVFASLETAGPPAAVSAIVAIGDNVARRREFEGARDRGYGTLNAVHPAAILSPRCTVGTGVMIMAGVVVNVGAEIGDNVILNTGCSVDHHCKVGPHSHIAPGARLAGEVTVGEQTLVGAGAVILPGTSVGDRCTIGAGAVVTRDVPSDCTAVGVPARIIRETGR
jgi:sugar O-acyltransferase (sialic acid O-acetyltransferase NeuD family)